MSLALIPRSARAISEAINRYFRVLKGIDPESVALRLPAAGSFEVRHSVTAAPLLRVTDAGIAATLGTANLADGAVTSAKIADGTIQGVDIATATITSDKLAGGIAVPANSITTNEIQDGTLMNVDINAAAGIAGSKLAAEATAQVRFATFGAINYAGATYAGIPASSVLITTTGKPVLVLMTLVGFRVDAGAASAQVVLRETTTGVNLMTFVDDNVATSFNSRAGVGVFTPAAGPGNYALYWQTSASTVRANSGTLALLELK